MKGNKRIELRLLIILTILLTIFVIILLIPPIGNMILMNLKKNENQVLNKFDKNYELFESTINELLILENGTIIDEKIELVELTNKMKQNELNKTEKINEYTNLVKLFKNVKIEYVQKTDNYIRYTIKTGWAFSQNIIKIYNEEESSKNINIKEKKQLKDNWYYIVMQED